MFKRTVVVLILVVFLLQGCDQLPYFPYSNSSTPRSYPTITLPPIQKTVIPANTSVPTELPAGGAPEETVLSPTGLPSLPTPVNPTEEPSSSQTALPPWAPQPANSDQESFDYALQPGTPMVTTGFNHPELGCKWMGVGGQVFNLKSEPVSYLIAQVGGTLNGMEVSGLSLTGSMTDWGPGGYEIRLAYHPIASNGTVWLQFFDLGDHPVSDKIYLTTYSDCNQNSILVNLVEIRKGPFYQVFFPAIFQSEPTTP